MSWVGEFHSSENEIRPREKVLWAYPIFLLSSAYIFGASVYSSQAVEVSHTLERVDCWETSTSNVVTDDRYDWPAKEVREGDPGNEA